MSEDVIQFGHTMMPAGRYFVGDPCYPFKDHDLWMKWLEASEYELQPPILDASVDGFKVVGCTTLYGDGVYFDQYGNEYGVDAGLIGAVPIEFAMSQGYSEDYLNTLGRVRTFEEDFVCSSWSDGRIQIGHFLIETGDTPEDEDDPYDESDESGL